MSTTTADPTSLTLKRHYKAPITRVFAAWTEPETLKRWFAPNPSMDMRVVSLDVRPGGSYRIEMVDPSGEIYDISGVYSAVEPPERLQFSWAWQSTPDRKSEVEVRLADDGNGGTHLTLTHSRFFDEAARDRHQEGWAAAIARLDDCL